MEDDYSMATLIKEGLKELQQNIADINRGFKQSEQDGQTCFEKAQLMNEALRIKTDLLMLAAKPIEEASSEMN